MKEIKLKTNVSLEELLEFINPTAFQFIDRIYDEFLDDPYMAREELENMPAEDLAEAAIAVVWMTQAQDNIPAYIKNVEKLLNKKFAIGNITKAKIPFLLPFLANHRKLIEDAFSEGIMLSITKAIQEML